MDKERKKNIVSNRLNENDDTGRNVQVHMRNNAKSINYIWFHIAEEKKRAA